MSDPLVASTPLWQKALLAVGFGLPAVWCIKEGFNDKRKVLFKPWIRTAYIWTCHAATVGGTTGIIIGLMRAERPLGSNWTRTSEVVAKNAAIVAKAAREAQEGGVTAEKCALYRLDPRMMAVRVGAGAALMGRVSMGLPAFTRSALDWVNSLFNDGCNSVVQTQGDGQLVLITLIMGPISAFLAYGSLYHATVPVEMFWRRQNMTLA